MGQEDIYGLTILIGRYIIQIARMVFQIFRVKQKHEQQAAVTSIEIVSQKELAEIRSTSTWEGGSMGLDEGDPEMRKNGQFRAHPAGENMGDIDRNLNNDIEDNHGDIM